jgi:hypothetical protein
MRRVLPAVLLSLIILHTSMAFAVYDGYIFSSVKSLKLKGLLDGKPTGQYMLVNFDVWYADEKWQVDWIEAHFIPMSKEVSLSVRHASTKEENVRNVVVNEDGISFDLISPSGEVDRVNCGKGWGFHIIPDVRITRTVINNKNRKVSLFEYVVTDSILLPFNEISGLPPPGTLFKEK